MDQKKLMEHRRCTRRVPTVNEGGRRALPLGCTPLSCGRLGDPPDMRLTPKIPINRETTRNKPRPGDPPPQAPVATKNLLGAHFGTLPEGESIIGGHLHHPGALYDEEGVVHPQG